MKTSGICFLMIIAVLALNITTTAQPPPDIEAPNVIVNFEDSPAANLRSDITTVAITGFINGGLQWDLNQEGCTQLHSDLYQPNQINSLPYYFDTHDFFAYVLVDEGDSCTGHCLDKNHGNGGGPALSGNCGFPSNSTSDLSTDVESVRDITGIPTPSGDYSVTIQICSACIDCVAGYSSRILWWQGTAEFDGDDMATEDDYAEIPLIYEGHIPCEEDLNCDNWPD